MPPNSDSALNKFNFISEVAEGEVLLPVWFVNEAAVPPYLQPDFPIYRIGRFRFHMFLERRFPQRFRSVARFSFYLYRGLQLHREKPFDFIMTYGTNFPGLAGALLKWITGAKFILEVPGVPEDAFVSMIPIPTWKERTKRLIADWLLNAVGGVADCFKLQYPWQLHKFPRLARRKAVVFHDFVPGARISPHLSEEDYILLVGYPWYLKGFDVVINAFLSVAAEFPSYKLKLMGGPIPDSDREYLQELARGCSQIEFVKPVPYGEALQMIGGCSLFVLASRSDALPLVMLEAMAARRPVIASAVGGVPHCIRDGIDGLLFPSQDVDALAEKMRILLNRPDLRAQLADRGYERFVADYDERAYVRGFRTMLCTTGIHTELG
jgi:glycosyltransferase involved in cell wall biosynthesis